MERTTFQKFLRIIKILLFIWIGIFVAGVAVGLCLVVFGICFGKQTNQNGETTYRGLKYIISFLIIALTPFVLKNIKIKIKKEEFKVK